MNQKEEGMKLVADIINATQLQHTPTIILKILAVEIKTVIYENIGNFNTLCLSVSLF